MEKQSWEAMIKWLVDSYWRNEIETKYFCKALSFCRWNQNNEPYDNVIILEPYFIQFTKDETGCLILQTQYDDEIVARENGKLGTRQYKEVSFGEWIEQRELI